MTEKERTEQIPPEKVRYHLRFYGSVQGVGFRYRALHAAAHLRLTGWVRNNWDDSVEMEVQGTEKEIWKMVAMIRQGTYIDITDMRKEKIPVDRTESSFRVRDY